MPDALSLLEAWLSAHPPCAVVDFDRASDTLFPFDFTSANTEFSAETLADTDRFTAWVDNKLSVNNCRYGIGGYNEHRTIYSRSELFDATAEPRRLHLGIDIWGEPGTKIYSPLEATVHSFHFNDNFGDYGATIILKHNLDGLILHTLYGHLSLASLSGLTEGKIINKGQEFAAFGEPQDNGHWPPHLHFQLIWDMKDHAGDYPGVCAYSERQTWLANSPDPMLILKYTF